MKTHPTNRKYRRQLEKEHNIKRDAFGIVLEKDDKYKPNIRNMPFCLKCHKNKLQFKTKESAERYIAFNSNKIYAVNGKAPIRAYFCTSCGCWHVTSQEKYNTIEILTHILS